MDSSQWQDVAVLLFFVFPVCFPMVLGVDWSVAIQRIKAAFAERDGE